MRLILRCGEGPNRRLYRCLFPTRRHAFDAWHRSSYDLATCCYRGRRRSVRGIPSMGKSYDAVVVGAGVFGAWTAWHLLRAGQRVLLVDKYGPASARASSGGETRVIRMAYGPDEVYTRLSQASLLGWEALFAGLGQPDLFRETGVLWLGVGSASRRETEEVRISEGA